MFKKYNKYALLKIFLHSPTESFRLRELSRLGKIAPLSVTNYLKEFEKDGLITKYKRGNIPFYKAARDNERFILYKKLSIIYELNESGLIDALWDKTSPDAIILYGSHAKGEAVEDSDIDIFIIGKEKEIEVSAFEKEIGKKIHLIFEPDTKKIPKELKNNLINGIVLKGYLKIF